MERHMTLGIVNQSSIWLYEDMKGTIADELFMGWAVRILKWEGNWYKIETHYGYKGYVNKDVITVITRENLQYRNENGQLRVNSGGMVDVLDEPRVQGLILTTLTRGAYVTVLNDEINGYQRVKLANGIEGYMPGIALRKRRDNDGFLLTDDPGTKYFCKQKLPMDEETFRDAVVSIARRYLGTQYRWAGKSGNGIDCSGLAFMSYMLSGVLIYRDAILMENYPIKEISMKNMKKGDLLYFPGHVALYMGDGKYIHSTGHKNSFGCVINSLKREDAEYREDLANTLYAVGSLF